MLNIKLDSVQLYQDVMSKNNAAIASKFLPKKKVLELVQRSSRDNARTPMQWTDDRYAGFTTGVPWFYVNGNYKQINVQAEDKNPDSLLNFYRRLLRFRKENPIVIYGDYRELMPEHEQLYVYERNYQGKKLLVVCSFTSEGVRFDAPEGINLSEGTRVLENYDYNFIIANGFTLRPYEMRAYLFE